MKMLVVINPAAKNGRSEQIKAIIRQQFASYIVGIIERSSVEKMHEDLQHRLDADKIDIVIAVGGDGTINAVLNIIAGRDVALGIIPAGTANDLASLYHIPADPERACAIIRYGKACQADLISVNGWCYVTAGGFGMASDVSHRANELKQRAYFGKLLLRLLGSRIYVLATLMSLFRKDAHRYPVTLRCNGSVACWDSLFLMIDNQHFLGSHFQMTPLAKNNDGRFDVCLIESLRSRLGILSIILQVLKGEHIYSPQTHLWQESELIVQTEQPLIFFADGETLPPARQFNIKLVPSALKIITPTEKGV